MIRGITHRHRQIPGFLGTASFEYVGQLGRVDTPNVYEAYMHEGWWCPSPLEPASKSHRSPPQSLDLISCKIEGFQTCTMAMKTMALTGVNIYMCPT